MHPQSNRVKAVNAFLIIIILSYLFFINLQKLQQKKVFLPCLYVVLSVEFWGFFKNTLWNNKMQKKWSSENTFQMCCRFIVLGHSRVYVRFLYYGRDRSMLKIGRQTSCRQDRDDNSWYGRADKRQNHSRRRYYIQRARRYIRIPNQIHHILQTDWFERGQNSRRQ